MDVLLLLTALVPLDCQDAAIIQRQHCIVYCLEDYVHLGLREEGKLGCTEKLQKWNQPKKRNVEPCPSDDVRPHKTVYGKEKRSKLQHVNNWDCRPSTRRIMAHIHYSNSRN